MVVSSPKNAGVLGLRAGATPQLLLSWPSGQPWEHLTGGHGQWLATVLSMMQVSALLGLGLYGRGRGAHNENAKSLWSQGRKRSPFVLCPRGEAATPTRA